MNKALNIIAVVVFLVAVASLVLGYMLWDKREELKGRADGLAGAVNQVVNDQQLAGVRSGLAEIEYTELEGQLTKFKDAARQKQAVLVETQQELSDTHTELDITKGTLEATRTNLDEANEQIKEHVETIAQRNQQLEEKDEQIVVLEDDLQGLLIRASEAEGLKDQVERLMQENKLLGEEVTKLEVALQRIGDADRSTATDQPGIVGRVLAVNPEWDFVVVSLGKEDNLIPTTQLLVFRNEQLIAKLKTTNLIEDDVAIANVEPGWRLDSIREGDNVLY